MHFPMFYYNIRRLPVQSDSVSVWTCRRRKLCWWRIWNTCRTLMLKDIGCCWQNRPNQHGHQHSKLADKSQHLCRRSASSITLLNSGCSIKKIHSVPSFECSPEILKTMQNQLFNFSLEALEWVILELFRWSGFSEFGYFLIERMTHLEHNEENFTFFIISENQWIMKYKLINFIYFKKLNLTSKAGLWTDAKSRLRMDGSVRWALKSKRWKWI